MADNFNNNQGQTNITKGNSKIEAHQHNYYFFKLSGVVTLVIAIALLCIFMDDRKTGSKDFWHINFEKEFLGLKGTLRHSYICLDNTEEDSLWPYICIPIFVEH